MVSQKVVASIEKKKILVSGVIKHKKAVLTRIVVGMLLITVFAGLICFVVEFRSNLTSRWSSLKGSLKYGITRIGIEGVETFYANNERSEGYEKYTKDVNDGVKALDIPRLYVYDHANKTYYYLHTESYQGVSHEHGEFYKKISGFIDDSSIADEERGPESTEPVYSYDVDHSTIKAWITIKSAQGNDYTIFGEAWVDGIIDRSWKVALTVIIVSSIITTFTFLFVYFDMIRPLLDSVSDLSDDLDSFYVTGELKERQASDQLIQKIRNDFEYLADNNTKFTKEQREQTAKTVAKEQLELINEVVESYLRPEGCRYINERCYPDISVERVTENASKGGFCDFFNIGEDKVGFLICSLPEQNDTYTLPLFIKYMYRTEMSDIRDLAASASNMSELLRKQFNGKYRVSAFFGYIDNTRRINFVNAGYSIPFYMTEEMKPDFLPGECSGLLGEDCVYTAESFRMDIDSYVVCFSDGVVNEPGNEKNKPYGRDGLRSALIDWKQMNGDESLSYAVMDNLTFYHGSGDYELEKLLMVIKV